MYQSVKHIIIYAVTKKKQFKIALGDIFLEDGSNQIFEYYFETIDRESKVQIGQDTYNYPAFYSYFLDNNKFKWLNEETFILFVKKCQQYKSYIAINKKSR